MMRFDFPGNVRQLENICHWLTVMAPAQMIEAKDLPPELAADAGAGVADVRAIAPSVTATPSTMVPIVDTAPIAAPAVVAGSLPILAPSSWLSGLERDARELLLAGDADVWDTLTHKFEAQLIRTALDITRGRRIEAAQKLGIGRNTITRKIQELGLDD
jgi:two-component system nitrogen regulation response regulator GlnG